MTVSVSPLVSPEQMLQQAATHHEAGRLAEAEQLYRSILEREAGHVQASYNLGVLMLQRQQPALAQPFFQTARQGDPAREQCWLACIEVQLQLHEFAEAHATLQQARQVLGASAALVATGQRLALLEAEHAEQLLALPPEAAEVLGAEVVGLVDRQRFADAEPLARRLVELSPRHAFAWQALGVVLEGLGRLDEALKAMRRAATLEPEAPEVNFNLGNLYKATGRLEDAEAGYLAALASRPDWAAAHLNLAALYIAQDRSEQAEASYRQALRVDGESAEAYNGLGVVVSRMGRHEDAEACYRRALAIRPDYAVAHSNLAVTLAANGRLDAAEASYRQALRLDAGRAEAHAGLAVLLERRGRFDEAARCCRCSLEILPEQPRVLANLGNLLARDGLLGEAEALCQRATQLQPEFAGAHLSLGNVLQKAGRLDEAEACWQRVLELDPECLEARQIRLFCMTHDARVSAEELFSAHRAVGELLEARWPAVEKAHGGSFEPERPLRIGFVSGDLRSHPVASFLEPILSHLDRDAFTLYAYSNHPVEDGVSARLRELVAVWRPVAELDTEALAERIRTDAIDILFDLAGHTGYNRLPVFALRPAPVQASWIGYPATTGLRGIDYYLVDEHCAPAGLLDGQFTEKLVRLPSIAAFQAPTEAPEVNGLPGLERGALTFGSFNRMSKLSDATLDLWCRVLRELPDAHMLVGALEDGAAARLYSRFAARGIAPERLSLQPRTDLMDYLRLHHRVDILLDTQPFSGWTVTNHALWMGVPTLMLPGRSLTGRACLGNLHAVGLDEFVALDADDYVRKAVAWSRKLPELARIRVGLRQRIDSAGQGAHLRVVAAVELALRQMWRRRCAGEAAAAFTVSNAAVDDYLAGRVCRAPVRLAGSEELARLHALLEAGRYAEAEVEARESIRRFPDQSFGWTALIGALRGLGRPAELVEPLGRLAELQPLNPTAHANLGIQQLNLGQLSEAEESLRRALELDAEHVPAWHALGQVMQACQRLDAAEQCYRRALAVAPEQARVANSLGGLLNEQGRFAEAEETYRQALQHAPDYVPLLGNRGKNLHAAGLLVEAEECLRQALAMQPGYAEARGALARVLLQQGRLAEAEALA